LRSKGINVITIKDTLDPHTPDSIFPNNWVSFHKDGKVVLYPMFASNRRVERRDDIIEILKNRDLKLLKLTTGLFRKHRDIFGRNRKYDLDHDNKIAYGSVSLRLDETCSENFVRNMVYPVSFPFIQTVGEERLPIYYQCRDDV
jgi:hypothetical protein